MEDVTSNTTIAVIMVCLSCHEEENWWSKTQMGRISFVGRIKTHFFLELARALSKNGLRFLTGSHFSFAFSNLHSRAFLGLCLSNPFGITFLLKQPLFTCWEYNFYRHRHTLTPPHWGQENTLLFCTYALRSQIVI